MRTLRSSAEARCDSVFPQLFVSEKPADAIRRNTIALPLFVNVIVAVCLYSPRFTDPKLSGVGPIVAKGPAHEIAPFCPSCDDHVPVGRPLFQIGKQHSSGGAPAAISTGA